MTTLCKCGCGEVVPRQNAAYVNKLHQLEHLSGDGGREMATRYLTHDVRVKAGQTSGAMARDNGRLAEAGEKGRASIARTVEEFRARQAKKA